MNPRITRVGITTVGQSHEYAPRRPWSLRKEKQKILTASFGLAKFWTRWSIEVAKKFIWDFLYALTYWPPKCIQVRYTFIFQLFTVPYFPDITLVFMVQLAMESILVIILVQWFSSWIPHSTQRQLGRRVEVVSLAGLHNKRTSRLIGTFSFAKSVLLLKW